MGWAEGLYSSGPSAQLDITWDCGTAVAGMKSESTEGSGPALEHVDMRDGIYLEL